jgi:hypothetical protein
MKTLVQFGEQEEGYEVPVLNEREIRASAGIMFLTLFFSFCAVVFENNFLLVKYVIVLFLTDFTIRVLLSPSFSPTLIVGRLIVSRQQPEYVAAAPKKFAWIIGLILSALMFFLLVLLNSYSVIISINCLLCLTFLFFETAFGICLGCWLYGLIYKKRPVHCGGASCERTNKHAIQLTSRLQILIVIGCIVYVSLTIIFFNDYLNVAPVHLRERLNTARYQGQEAYIFPTINFY